MHNEAGNTVAAALATTQSTQHSLTTFVLPLKFMSGQIFFLWLQLIRFGLKTTVKNEQTSPLTQDVTQEPRRNFHLHVKCNITGTRVMV